MDDKIFDWVMLAEKFSVDGDPLSMRTAAQEIFALDENSADGFAIMAEASLYLDKVDEAEYFAGLALESEPKNLRARLVAGGVAIRRIKLREQLKIFDELVSDAHDRLKNLQDELRNFNRQFAFNRRKKNSDDENFQRHLDKKISLARSILFKALSWYSNGLYLSGEPDRAASSLLEASTLTDDEQMEMELYSKHLFLRNYRDVQPAQIKQLAQKYNSFFSRITPFRHDKKFFDAEKIHVGYISPDFREHAIANFVTPFLRDYDAENFSVTCYSTGKKDFVTEKLKAFDVQWRSVTGREPHEIARLIDEDGVDILVDLSGHSQDSCLPVLAYKPAPVQICALGYTATTGLTAVDYFLSDKICSPENFSQAFTEKILRLNTSCLCYSPGLIREIPDTASTAPVMKNNFVTFCSFNNFAKVSDEVLFSWRAILERVPRSRLVLKGKIFSLDDGKEIVTERFKRIGFPLDRVEFCPYSPDYLEQYRDVDIMLDTFPYTGGTTTCEALYMGVPVVTVRGKTHGARLSASILSAADCAELIASNTMDYIQKAVKLSQRPELITAYHVSLRDHLKKSALMDGVRYMRGLEKIFRTIN